MIATLDLCAVGEIADGEARRFDVEGHRIAVVRIGDTHYAIGDRCSHADVSLSEGEVDAEECAIECWKHGSSFSLTTGMPLSLPATRPVPVYDVVIASGRVTVAVSAAAPSDGVSA